MTKEKVKSPKKRRTAIWIACGVALTLVVIILFAYACTKGRPSALIYRYTHGGRSLYSALYHGARNGDTTEEIENLLGPGRKANSAKIIGTTNKMIQKNPAGWPDGVEDSDAFLGFTLPGGELFLQFRDGELINFNPDDFAKYEFIGSIAN